MIGFVELPSPAAEPDVDCGRLPITAERAGDGRKRAALLQIGFAFAEGRLVWAADRDGSRYKAWLLPADAAIRAACHLERAGELLPALQIRRAVAEI